MVFPTDRPVTEPEKPAGQDFLGGPVNRPVRTQFGLITNIPHRDDATGRKAADDLQEAGAERKKAAYPLQAEPPQERGCQLRRGG